VTCKSRERARECGRSSSATQLGYIGAVADLSGIVLEGRYRLDAQLAGGAMGVVYRATHLRLDRAVAIKLMHASLRSEMAARARFEREAKLLALVEHPHCVSVIDYGLHDQKPYLVMELVRGRSLHELLVEQPRFDVGRAADVLRQVLSGLAHAHDRGIIHRDIKPANIMVTAKEPLGVHVRILDFGLARLREASTSLTDGLAVGTPSYMAPEQCRGEDLDARVDLYACGVLLFEMLAGRKPFVAKDPIEIVKKQMHEAPPTLAAIAGGDYGGLEAVVARALAKAPDDRFATATAMSVAIDAATGGQHAPEPTSVIAPQLGSSALVPIESSVDVPITVGSSVRVAREEPPTSSALRRMLPVSRARWLALSALVLAGAAVATIVAFTRDDGTAEPQRAAAPIADAAIAAPADAAVDPIAEVRGDVAALVADGRLDAALDALAKARRRFPDDAALAFDAGKIYFARLWWADGIKSFRDAIRLDAKYKDDRELVAIAVRGFATTPEYDDRLGGFLLELGAAAGPALDELARTHANPRVRTRAAAQLRRAHLQE
jgi:serine/threonine-protein kinase